MIARRAQTSFEFLVLLSFMLVMFGGFFVVGEDLLVQNNQALIKESLIQTAQGLRDEILVANQVPDGYSRNFSLPVLVQEQTYTLSVYENEIVIETEDDIEFEYILFLPFDVGDETGTNEIVLGTRNEIRKVDDSPAIQIVVLESMS